MKKILFVAVLISFCNVAMAGDATATFNTLRGRINSVRDYIAEVKIKIDVSYMKIPQLSGKLYFKAPGKLRMERTGGITILPKKSINLTLNSLLPTGNATVIDGGMDKIGTLPVHIIIVLPQGESDIVLTKLWVDESRMLALRTETTTRDNGTIKTELEWGRFTSLNLPDRVIFFLDVKDYKLPKGATMDYDDGTEVVKRSKDAKNKKGKITITYLSYKVNSGISDAVFTDGKR